MHIVARFSFALPLLSPSTILRKQSLKKKKKMRKKKSLLFAKKHSGSPLTASRKTGRNRCSYDNKSNIRVLDCPQQRQHDETIAEVRFTSVLETHLKCSVIWKLREWSGLGGCRFTRMTEVWARNNQAALLRSAIAVQRIRNKRLSYKLRWYLPENSVPLESSRTNRGEDRR